VIYVDSSIALAELLSEKKRPSATFWAAPMASSRLLEYEVTVRLNALGSRPRVLKLARDLLDTVKIIDLDAAVLARALEPFPISVRTLDAIHLATMVFLRRRGFTIELATYDQRLGDAATALGFARAAV
jgi:predicted nucleic acid-binding protein